MNDLEAVVDEVMKALGYSSCKPEQRMAAVNILQGLDVFISVPTGYGKSAAFDIP